MENTKALEQIARLEDLAEEEKGIADALFILDVAAEDCGKAAQLFVNFSQWIYRHQKDLVETHNILEEYIKSASNQSW